MPKASDVLAIARAELEYTENPRGSNRTKYGKWFGMDGNPWCMMFVQWCFAQAEATDLLPNTTTASCGTMMWAAQAAGCWVTGDYRAGDVVIYDFPGGAATDHTGIVESITASGIVAIEGNTGTGNDANGGQVQERPRNNDVIKGAVRPAYDPEESEEDEVVTYEKLKDVPEKFRPIIDKLMTAGIIQGDGSDAAGNGDIINLTHEQVRTLVFIYRGGGFDRKLQAVGMETAV
ncbi:CHAP domain-containing protein [Oscillibacter sp.]|uniref:CHAP domain-containing protein n=1 Tax=Oscillibacter sp. TaxID=1945593 RepID=UPI00339188B3